MERVLTVIIAEDKLFDRQKLELFANQLGLKVVSAIGSGEWLIDDCVKYKPDLIFLDIGLNGTDGLTAYKRVLEKGLSSYLIVVSGTQDSTLILAGFKMNCVDFVTKPVTYKRLSEAVEKAKATIEKDLLISTAIPSKIIQIKSKYHTIFLNENKLIYAHKVKGQHKSIVYVEGEEESGVETSASLKDIHDQCSEFIFSPNQSTLINVNYIKKVFASDNFLDSYIIKLDYKDTEIDLPRRKRKEFEQLYARLSQVKK
ncbi:LytR/AlgR family response regulator transcription factor [Paenibacillus sp. SI8]|uniref:LytR/AlgR family response regulator transcription factor n=1 Tax=unclassified Paenibacillus TaxID=185978 RepID=UPI0034656E29